VSAGQARERIVLVDDDADFLEMNESVLESGGYAVSCFADPRAALAAMTADPPALLVTDLMMSALDAGFSLARAVKSAPGLAHVPIVIITAAASRAGFNFHPRTPEDLAAMHADAFFDKPVAPDQLIAKVEELLGRPPGGGAAGTVHP
jgi:CheY-like chemotaxis protein